MDGKGLLSNTSDKSLNWITVWQWFPHNCRSAVFRGFWQWEENVLIFNSLTCKMLHVWGVKPCLWGLTLDQPDLQQRAVSSIWSEGLTYMVMGVFDWETLIVFLPRGTEGLDGPPPFAGSPPTGVHQQLWPLPDAVSHSQDLGNESKVVNHMAGPHPAPPPLWWCEAAPAHALMMKRAEGCDYGSSLG